jgi:hypothetical protein
VIDELKAVGAEAKLSLDFALQYCEVITDVQYQADTPGESLRILLGSYIYFNCIRKKKNRITLSIQT